jgi:hypothetical protein
MFNTTYSDRAELTGCKAFAYGLRELNMIVASNDPLRFDPNRLKRTLAEYQIDGAPVFNFDDPVQTRRFDEVTAQLSTVGTGARVPLESCDSVLARTAGQRAITDNNMGEEWRLHGLALGNDRLVISVANLLSLR